LRKFGIAVAEVKLFCINHCASSCNLAITLLEKAEILIADQTEIALEGSHRASHYSTQDNPSER